MMLKEYDHGKVCMHVCVCLLCTSLDTYYIYTLIHHMYVIYKDREREIDREREREREKENKNMMSVQDILDHMMMLLMLELSATVDTTRTSVARRCDCGHARDGDGIRLQCCKW